MRNTVHRRQLFHWIGSHIKKSPTSEDGAREYISALKESINNGLWFTVSNQENEKLWHVEFTERFPMICFTDNKLSDCQYHAQNYGKLALGFPKRFVMKKFGMPVNYVINKKTKNPYLLSLGKIGKFIEKCKDEAILKHWKLVSNHIKPMYKIKTKSQESSNGNNRNRKSTQSTKKRWPRRHRNFGWVLDFYVEHEWRIVLSKKLKKEEGVYIHDEKYKLKYDIEQDLYTIVFPSRIMFEIMRVEETELAERIQSSSNLNTYILDEIDQL